jgi:16S rRNA processing protein RimM
MSASQDVRFLVIGRILGPQGTSGAVRAQVLTDYPARFESLPIVHVGDSLRPYNVQSAKLEGDTVVLKLAGIDDSTTAVALRNQDLQVPVDQAVELPQGHYFWHQIIGLEIWTDTGQQLGRVSEVLRTGSNDVYVVRSGLKELLIPAIEDVVLNIDLPGRRIVVHLLPGLVDEQV